MPSNFKMNTGALKQIEAQAKAAIDDMLTTTARTHGDRPVLEIDAELKRQAKKRGITLNESSREIAQRISDATKA